MTTVLPAEVSAEQVPVEVSAELEELDIDECLRLLAVASTGRIAFVVAARPVLFPVSYRFLRGESGPWILLRTRPSDAIGAAPEHVAFEVGGMDHIHQEGWSVLVRGVIYRLDHNEVERFCHQVDPKAWVQQERNSWLAIKPQTITGRRLHAAQPEWSLPSEAYV
jgi:nitroimidazol reductase NimA-like FMN-containing flavoprotein (pyridoxamine 5'-phosphate oxidase superfamily)